MLPVRTADWRRFHQGKEARKLDTKLSQFIDWAWPWLKRGAIAFGLTVIVGILVYLVTGRNGDLVAWLSESTPIYPSEQTNNLTLPLYLSGKPVKSLTFVSMRISNGGKLAIGSQEQRWIFHVTGPREAMLRLIGEPHGSSKRLVLSQANSPAANAVDVQIGSLEPREFFDIHFIVANASDPYPRLSASTTLQGLPEPIVTDSSPAESAGAKLAPYFWGTLYLLLIVGLIVNRHRQDTAYPEILQKIQDWRLRLAAQAVLGVVTSGVVAGVLALAIGWIAATLWRLGVVS